MNILDEMRIEAAVMSDSDVAVILDIAFRGMQKDRWEKLRKRLAFPADEKEAAYVYALNQYVKAKLDLRRYQNLHLHGRAEELERTRIRWRAEMDRIEFDLSPGLVEELMHRLSFFRLKDDIAEIGFSAEQLPSHAFTGPYSRPEIDSPYFVKNNHEGIVLKNPCKEIAIEDRALSLHSRFDDVPGEAPTITSLRGSLKGRKVKQLTGPPPLVKRNHDI